MFVVLAEEKGPRCNSGGPAAMSTQPGVEHEEFFGQFPAQSVSHTTAVFGQFRVSGVSILWGPRNGRDLHTNGLSQARDAISVIAKGLICSKTAWKLRANFKRIYNFSFRLLHKLAGFGLIGLFFDSIRIRHDISAFCNCSDVFGRDNSR